MNVNDVMDAVGTALTGISGLRVRDYTPDSISPPAVMFGLPTIEYDSTMGRGSDDLTFVVSVLVGKVSDRSARDALAEYMAGSGSKSIKETLEDDPTLGGEVHTLRVESAESVVVTVGSIDYLAAEFTINVVA